MELEAGVAEMCFNRAFGAVQPGSNLFYRQVLGVVEEKDLFASLCEMLDRCAKVCSKFLTFEVSAGIRMRLGDTAFHLRCAEIRYRVSVSGSSRCRRFRRSDTAMNKMTTPRGNAE